MVEFMVKFIWQHNLLVGLEGWIFGAQRAKNETPPVTPKLKVREVSQSGFEISHHTQLLCQVSAKSVDHNFWPLEHFLRL